MRPHTYRHSAFPDEIFDNYRVLVEKIQEIYYPDEDKSDAEIEKIEDVE